jgi:hypothetical protein
MMTKQTLSVLISIFFGSFSSGPLRFLNLLSNGQPYERSIVQGGFAWTPNVNAAVSGHGVAIGAHHGLT